MLAVAAASCVSGGGNAGGAGGTGGPLNASSDDSAVQEDSATLGDTGSASTTDGGKTDGGTPDGAVDAGSATDSKVVPPADTGPVGPPPPTVAAGSFSAAIDNWNFVVDYAGAPVSAKAVHKLNSTGSGTACVAGVQVSVAKPDGSCKLELVYEPPFQGKGLQLKSLNFYAKVGVYQGDTLVSTLPCQGWTKESAKGEVVYQAQTPQGSLDFGPLSQPSAGQTEAKLTNQLLKPLFTGKTTMTFQNRTFTSDFSKLAFSGEVISLGNPAAQCDKVGVPLPQFQLVDISPNSPGFNKKYGLEAFAGKKVVVALVSDWCNSCRAQAKMMQQLQDSANANGKADTVMVLINDKQKSNPADLFSQIKNIPIFQDVAGVDAWGKMNAPHAGKFTGSAIRNSGYGFAKNGTEIMYFAPNGTGSLNLTAFQQAVQKVISAPDPAP